MIHYFFIFSRHYVFDMLAQAASDGMKQIQLPTRNLLRWIYEPISSMRARKDADRAKI
jgi:hypothetical protein